MQLHGSSVARAVSAVLRREGWRGLYSGVRAQLLGTGCPPPPPTTHTSSPGANWGCHMPPPCVSLRRQCSSACAEAGGGRVGGFLAVTLGCASCEVTQHRPWDALLARPPLPGKPCRPEYECGAGFQQMRPAAPRQHSFTRFAICGSLWEPIFASADALKLDWPLTSG